MECADSDLTDNNNISKDGALALAQACLSQVPVNMDGWMDGWIDRYIDREHLIICLVA